MAHKVAVVPIFGVDPPSELFQLCERCFRAFTVARMDKPWMNSVEWNILVESENLPLPDTKFRPLIEFAKYEEKFDRIAAAGNSSQKLKKIIRHALTLQWNSTDILSPVKKRTSLGGNGLQRAKVIVLAGTIAKEDFDAKLITDSVLKWALNTEIRIVHLAAERVFKNIEFLDSKQEITRFSDLVGISLAEMVYEKRILATPEGVSETTLNFMDQEYKIKVTAREKIKLVEIRAELTSNSFVSILSQLLGERPFQGTCSANVNKDLLPLVGKMFIVRLNEERVAIASISRPIPSKIVFQFRKTKENFKLPVLNNKTPVENSYPGHILSAPAKATVDMTRFDFSYLKTAADNSGKGLSLLQRKIEEMTKLTKKEGVDHDNILPRKLRVRSTPTKTPMKCTPTSSVPSTPRRNSSARGATPQTPQNENRELKRLCRYFPDSISSLEDQIKNAMKYSCYVTVCKLCTNFLSKNAQIGLKEMRKTKDEIFDGKNENITRLCKLQFLFYLLDKDTNEGELRELGTLMRWFTFSSSPADLNGFFEETIIPLWIEKNDQEMIQKLLDVYNDLMLNVPKVLVKYLPANSDSDSSPDEEEDEDAITVEPSSVSTSSVISFSSSVFSNNSRAVDSSTQMFSRKLSSSNQNRMIQIRNMSEPLRKSHRRESKTRKEPSPLANKLGPRKSDRAKRALFMASPDPKAAQRVQNSTNSSRVQSQPQPSSSSNVHRTPGKSLPKPKVLHTRSAKDTPLKAQEMGTRSSRSKFRSLRRERKRKVSSSELVNKVEESPMKNSEYTPKAGPIRKLLKEDDQLNTSALNSTADLLSPRDGKLAHSLLFGGDKSEASSSDDEVISSRSAVSEKIPPARFTFTSPIRAGNENELLSPSKRSHRRKLTTEVGPSPLSKNDDLLNKSFDDLKSGEMVGQRAGVQDAHSSVRMKKFPGVKTARRKLRLSESEK